MTSAITMKRNVPRDLAEAVENQTTRFRQKCEDPTKDYEVETLLGREDLRAVWAASEFVATCCIVNPTLLHDLVGSGDLDRSYSPGELGNRVARALENIEDVAQLNRSLRKQRRREMVRIAWRDLAGFAALEETMAGVSELASACIAGALEHHHRWLSARYGDPMGADGNASSMIVLGLGKLGGLELNFSSDVDLIFCYDNPGQTESRSGDSGPIDNQEYFTRLGQRLVTSLDALDRDGYVFRTDMRLRPNGESGPLVLSFPAMEHYYQTHGRDWERYALIKASVVAGDGQSGEVLRDLLRPFVYRKYLDFGAFDAIREMKRMIERELQQKAASRDIKRGRGGIREVEFLVQSHQLIRGGRETALQTSSLYQAMDALVDIGVLDENERQELMDGYRFLRNTEHRLQMASDQQTHRLPEQELEQIRLAWSMGFDNWPSYVEALDKHRENIHQQFRMILDDRSRASAPQSQERLPLEDLWEGRLDDSDAGEALIAAGFDSVDSTPRLLDSFRKGRLYQAFSGIERDRLDRLVPLALQQAGQLPESERAIAAFVTVIEAIGRRTVYLSLLIENPIALRQLLHLCAASPWISRHIGQHPVVLDELLNPLVDIRKRNHEDLMDELEHRLDQIDEGDEERRMNTLREFQNAQVLRIAAADVTGVLTVEDVHTALTQLAEVLVRVAFNDALDFTRSKIEDPMGEAGLIAYGKFASGELGYHSDLDIVVCYDVPGDSPPGVRNAAEHFYSRVGRRLIHLLTTRTQAGVLYEIDLRLRPSGRSGTLVTSLSGFFDYQRSQAWTWEHQALVRARVVVGSDRFLKRFEQNRSDILSLPRNIETLRHEVAGMRRKMIAANCLSTETEYDLKLDEGGIVDIEFLIQYWILLHGCEHPDLMLPRTTSDMLSTLVGCGVVEEETGRALLDCYQTYLRHSLNLKLMDKPVLAPQDQLLEERRMVRKIWGETLS